MPDLLAALDAFVQEHRRCGELDSAVDDGVVWIACDCGAVIMRRPSYSSLRMSPRAADAMLVSVRKRRSIGTR